MDNANATLTENATTLAQTADARRQQGLYLDANDLFSRAVELCDDYAWAWAHWGATLYPIGAFDEAITKFDRALELRSDYAWAYAHRGEAYRQRYKESLQKSKGEDRYYDNAIADFNRAIELSGGEQSLYAWAFAHRGATHRLKVPGGYLGQPDQRSDPSSPEMSLAIADFERALRLTGGETKLENSIYAWALAYLATMLMLKGEYKDAFYFYMWATSRNPNVVANSNVRLALNYLYQSKVKNGAEKAEDLSQAMIFSGQAFAENQCLADSVYVLAITVAQLDQIRGTKVPRVGVALTALRESSASALCSLAGFYNTVQRDPEQARTFLSYADQIDPIYTIERWRQDPGLTGLAHPAKPAAGEPSNGG